MSQDNKAVNAAVRTLLAEPAADRTRIIVVSDDDFETLERMPVPIAKAIGVAVASGALAGAGAAAYLFTNPMGWATLAGLGVSYPAYRKWVRPYLPVLRAQRGLDATLVATSVASRLRMPQGAAQAGTLYVVHPQRDREYLPAGPFHLLLAQEKVSEAMGLIRALGAFSIEVRAEFAEESREAVHAVLEQAAGAVNATDERHHFDQGAVEEVFHCDGSDEPYVPEGLSWLAVEPTWQELVEGRLSTTNRIRSFTVLVHLDQSYGFNAELATAARKHDVGLGGEFNNSLRRVWRMTAEFPEHASARKAQPSKERNVG